MINKIAEEKDDGNHEYKYRLINIDKDKLIHLSNQLLYRLVEGNGEAIYSIGVLNNGYLIGINKNEMDESLRNLSEIAKMVDATVCAINRNQITVQIDELRDVLEHMPRIVLDDMFDTSFTSMYIDNSNLTQSINSIIDKNDLKIIRNKREYTDILIRYKYVSEQPLSLGIAFLGSAGSSKSTTISCLSRNILDDNHGSARNLIARHKHEIVDQRTSSIGYQLIGFNDDGKMIESDINIISYEKIMKDSCKIVTLYDMAGQKEYLKTTIHGLSGNFPDYAMVMLSANSGITPMTKEHIGLCVTLKIPFIILYSKIDIAPPNMYEENLSNIQTIVSRLKKKMFIISNLDELNDFCKFGLLQLNHYVPLIPISCVNGTGLPLIRTLLYNLPLRFTYDENGKKEVRCTITNTYDKTGIGTVVTGFVSHGIIKTKDVLLVGPIDNKFYNVKIKSIEINHVKVENVTAGNHVGLNITMINTKDNIYIKMIHEGMNLLSPKLNPLPIKKFEAKIYVLHSSTTIKEGYCPMAHINNIRQTVKLLSYIHLNKKNNLLSKSYSEEDSQVLRCGDEALCIFEFQYRTEWFEVGSNIILREGTTKGCGKITNIF